jgi:hypothetical protein
MPMADTAAMVGDDLCDLLPEGRVMDAPATLAEVLRDLRSRRSKLTLLAGQGAALDPVALLAEIGDLSEELLAADALLLVQQEQLDSTRAELELLSATLSTHAEDRAATITTDAAGAILGTSPTADTLLQIATPRGVRPITTRFATEDRPAIRTLIGRVGRSAPGARASTSARIVRRDQSLLPVRVTATAALDPETGQMQVTWLLEPVTDHSAMLTGRPAQAATDKALLELCYELSAAANRQATVTELAQFIARIAADLATTDAAAVAVTQAPKEVTAWATDDSAREASASQFAAREGPAYEAMAGSEPRHCDTGDAELWPTHGAYLEGLGFRHELALPLHCRNVRATLSVYSATEAAFSSEVRERLGLFARHAATVLAQADVEANLRVAVHSRQQVGQAVGILVERHRITPRAAFDRLVRASNITQTKLRDLAALLIETGEEPRDG